MKRRLFLVSAGLLTAPSLAQAEQRGVTLLVPFAEGGATDQLMRVLAKSASKALGQEIRLENKPSRTGLRLLSQLRAAPPDGSVVMLFPVVTLRALVERGVDFSLERDATPIMCLAGGTYGVIAKTDRFPGGWRDFVAEARQKPGQLSFGSIGVGSVGHVTMSRLMAKENLQVVHLPFRGAAEGAEALMAGDLDVMAGGARLHTAVDHGDARWLTLWSPTRNPRWPDVPTLVELGYGLTETAPFGLIGPPNMPAAERKRLEEAFTAALRSPQVRSVMARLGMTEDLRDGAAYSAYLAAAAGEEAALGLRPEARQ
ncbi:MAG: tripartite tricarboxylate transporter substrate binding protein [Roseomonas sp.]|nr:tripartite tricarboxylate transporter substrate binding protein [Roseomonas sp.]